jgi:hypothetical protein
MQIDGIRKYNTLQCEGELGEVMVSMMDKPLCRMRTEAY